MENEAAGSPSGKLPYEAALIEVIKGLHRDPVLLFGIGAGILVVGALAVTQNLTLVLVIAGVFVVVLVARAHQQAQAIRGMDVRARFSRVRRNTSSGALGVRSWFSTVEDNVAGSPEVTQRSTRPEG